VLYPETGSPQGGIISPILANVYLHYALDLWFQKVVAPQCSGEACLIRFADDFVCAFEKGTEAQQFYQALGTRLGKFGLELSAEKTQIVPFSVNDRSGETSFDFLGFEFRWGKDRKGKPHVMRRTARKSLRKSLVRFKEWCRENRHLRMSEIFKRLNTKLRGYYNYYGVHGNIEGLKEFYHAAVQLLWKYLNQRSQRHSINWVGFKQLAEVFRIEKPRIVGRPRRASMAPGKA
jgi:RNA-directed DNA polymerase